MATSPFCWGAVSDRKRRDFLAHLPLHLLPVDDLDTVVRGALMKIPNPTHAYLTGLNAAGSRLSPWMKFDLSLSGLPVASISGSLRNSSVIITMTSRRAR